MCGKPLIILKTALALLREYCYHYPRHCIEFSTSQAVNTTPHVLGCAGHFEKMFYDNAPGRSQARIFLPITRRAN
jgi:hypothetical protein